MSQTVRVRFAPSPTGPLHIGGIRTALFNYLFAKKHRGSFVLRIEDTDQNRYVAGAEQYIIDALEWCGIPYDEGPGKDKGFGPYRQSERQALYKKYADELISKGRAYYAFDTPESLDNHRKDHEAGGKTFIYNWHNRLKLNNSLSLGLEEAEERIAKGDHFVIRFKSPQDEEIILNDIVRGEITIDSNTLDDKILFKSDGMPTYHLANIVDDHLMEISHVIRGEEWLPSLALHSQLYDAFGWKAPEFAHLPLIMKPVGKGKLSKRDGEKGGFPIYPLSWEQSAGYKEAGYFPEAVVNFLAMLGWNPGTPKELFSLEELIESFSLERVHKSGARFDPEKTVWYNHHYLQEKSDDALLLAFAAEANRRSWPVEGKDDSFIKTVLCLLKERANFVSDFWDLGSFFFIAPETYNEKAARKQWKDNTPEILKAFCECLKSQANFDPNALETNIKKWMEQEEISFGQLMAPLRLSLVGELKGPHIFDILSLLGKEESLARIERAMRVLSGK